MNSISTINIFLNNYFKSTNQNFYGLRIKAVSICLHTPAVSNLKIKKILDMVTYYK